MFIKRSKGFTLVELIIAITILGLLAVGLLAALDPAEQFAKGRDTSTSQIAQTVSGAIERYRAALNNALPGAAGAFPAGTAADNSVLLNSADGNSIINGLVSAGELKANFLASAASALPNISIMRDMPAAGTTGSIYLCYKPTSKAFQMQGGQYYLVSSGALTTGVKVALSGITQRPMPGSARPTTPNPPFQSIATGGIDCPSIATSPTNRDYCVFCYEQ